MKKLFLLAAMAITIIACEEKSDPQGESGLLDLMGSGSSSEYAAEDYEEAADGSFNYKQSNSNGLTAAMNDTHYNAIDNENLADPPPPIHEKKIIRTGDIYMEVDTFAKARVEIDHIIAKNKAYISHEDNETNDYRQTASITIRVPNDNFDQLMSGVNGIASEVIRKTINARDVSEEFVDIQARLKTKKEVLKRYKSFLLKAKTIEEVLLVENNMRSIQEEIEAKEGRLKYLSDQIDYSTLSLKMFEEFEQIKKDEVKEPSFFSRVGDGLHTGWKRILFIILSLIYNWPLVLFILAVIFGYKRYRAKKKSA